jgi:hypothetical protein
MRRLSLIGLLLLMACQREVPAPAQADAGPPTSALEQAAIDSGVVADVARISPVGLYTRRHEAGRDTLCVVPDGRTAFRFGAQAVFGTDEQCQGKGTARRAGDKLILRFPSADCTIVAQYDGDRLAMPGVVDLKCAALCEGRGTFEGVAFPRVANGGKAAMQARDRDGDTLCPG